MNAFYERSKTDRHDLDARLAGIVRDVTRIAPSDVLDIGCGRGFLLERLRERLPGTRLFGCDVSEDSTTQARALGFDARTADVATGLPFAGDSFDCVVFGEVIEHLVDPDASLVEIARVLRRDGWLVVTTPNIACWQNRILLALGVQPLFTETSLHANLGRRLHVLGQWYPTQGHLKVFTLAALREMLEANGFAPARVYGTPFVRQPIAAQIDALLSRVPQLAPGLTIVARNRGTRTTHYACASSARERIARWW